MIDLRRLSRTISLVAAIGCAAFGLLAAAPAASVGERSVILTQDADYFGRDIETLKDVDLETCERSCLDDGACKAFTYNAHARWCFKKGDAGDLRAFVGAIAGRIVEPLPAAADLRKVRRTELGWLDSDDLDQARKLEGAIADRPAEGWLAALLEQADRAGAADDSRRLAAVLKSALRLAPGRSDLWRRLSEADIRVPADAGAARDEAVSESTGAAINGYLFAASDGDRLEALDSLANSFATRGVWNFALKALRQRLALAEDPVWRKAYDDWTAEHGFRVTDNSVDTEASTPRICVAFSAPIAKGDANIASYIKVSGGDFDIEAEDEQLCAVGVEYGGRYHVTVRKGLPARDPEVALTRTVDIDVYVRDRDPSVRFLGKAYVLPAVPAATIPVVSVNVDTINARVIRIGDRNLVNAMGEGGKFLSQLDKWEADNLADRAGRELWSGTVAVKRDTNREVTTAIPVGELVTQLEPGVYALVAKADNDKQEWGANATQWFIVSDLGLTTLTGNDGLHVVVRSLSGAKAVAGVRLALLAVDNDVLGEAVTDAEGYARFDVGLIRGTGGAAPQLVTARADADFAFIDLGKAAFDLTDRGVLGRDPPKPVDVFMTCERGVYRPGEAVALTILARDPAAAATDGVPLTVVVRRPDGNEFLRRLVADEGAGGRALLFELPGAAMRGTWRAAVYADPKADVLRETTFKVEDFEPERLDFTLSTDAPALIAGESAEATVKADWLYGAPAAGLSIEGEVYVRPAAGLPAAPGYKFGLADDDFTPATEDISSEGTGDDGTATVTLAAPDLAATTLPLEAELRVRVLDTNGRPVERTLTLPVAGGGGRIGLRPLFEGNVDEGGNARFNVMTLDADMKPAAANGLKWSLSRIETRYQWYRENGSWDYHAVKSSRRVADGTLDVAADVPAAIEARVDWGQYRLDIKDPAEKLLPVSLAFEAGWYVAATAEETPDLLKVTVDRPRYRIGETVKVHIEPRFAGLALLAVVDDRLIAMKTVEVPKEGATIALPVTDEWGPGAYVTATLIRPLDLEARRMPSRALGLTWAAVDPGDRLLKVAVDAPAEMRPRTPLDIAVKVDGIKPGEDAYVTVAAVDVGILNMTAFKAPAPEDWYFAQRRLGMEFRDVYGQLIDTTIGALGAVKSGGDGGGISRLLGPPPTEKLVAFFEGVTRVDADGMVRASFPMPDFNGTVKVMAIAWSKRGVGHAAADVKVRDPVVIQAALPNFLAPGDRSRLKLDFIHVEGPSGAFALEVTSDGSVVGLDAALARRSLDLADKGRAEVLIPITGEAVGDGAITARLTTPDGTVLEKELALGVRDNAPPEARVSDSTLKPGDGLTLDSRLFAGLKPGSALATVTVGTVAGIDLPGLVHRLDKYPYGCAEQLTSRALPLLYLDDVALAAGLPAGEPVRARVEKAIAKLLVNQGSDGAFGLWGPGGGDDDLWLDAYVTDFLTRAREQDYQVPDVAFDLAVTNLKNRVAYAADFSDGGEDVAYALYVLARNGRASIGDLRYFAEARRDAFGSPLAVAEIGAALALYGEPQKAEEVFAAALDRLSAMPDKNRKWRADYGSDLRDGAAIVALAAESRLAGFDYAALTARLGRLYKDARHTSTQEEGWLLMAANAMLRQGGRPLLDVGGTRHEGVYTARFEPAALASPLVIGNDGAAPVTARLTVSGIPLKAPPAGGNGYELVRSWYDLDGNAVNPATVPLGQRMVVVLAVTTTRSQWARLVVDDPLPAGFAIDNPSLIRAGEVSALDWLDPVETVAHSEYRTDRFVAALDREDDATSYQFAYMVRAIAPGRFALPAATLSDMYRPERQAHTAAGTVEVVGPLR